MKRFIMILFGVMFLFASCKKDNSIKYNGGDIVNIVLLEEFNLNASSNSKLTYHSDNELFVTVDNEGKIIGKNVGEANVTISNSTQSIVVKVVVSLFEEPTFDFGASPEEIKDIYGNPKHNFGDSIFVYGSGNDWYSYAVWEMDFFFEEDMYFESDLYIRNDLTARVDEFVNNKYHFQNEFIDTIFINESNTEYEVVTYYIYLNAEDPVNADVMIGKIYDADDYGDICLFYTPFFDYKNYEFKDVLRRIIDKRKRDEQ